MMVLKSLIALCCLFLFQIPDCQNHIRAVMPDVNDENKLFVCGTGGYAPTKYTLDVSMRRI